MIVQNAQATPQIARWRYCTTEPAASDPSSRLAPSGVKRPAGYLRLPGMGLLRDFVQGLTEWALPYNTADVEATDPREFGRVAWLAGHPRLRSRS